MASLLAAALQAAKAEAEVLWSLPGRTLGQSLLSRASMAACQGDCGHHGTPLLVWAAVVPIEGKKESAAVFPVVAVCLPFDPTPVGVYSLFSQSWLVFAEIFQFLFFVEI